jgi:hypothetical protein
MIRVVHPRSRIRMLTFSHPGSRIQGSKRHRIRIRNTAYEYIEKFKLENQHIRYHRVLAIYGGEFLRILVGIQSGSIFILITPLDG